MLSRDVQSLQQNSIYMLKETPLIKSENTACVIIISQLGGPTSMQTVSVQVMSSFPTTHG